MAVSAPWPSEIRLGNDRRTLTVAFDDGVTHALPAEMLRVLSPSAEVQGHSAAQRITVAGKRQVAITAVDQVGNYAVRLTFDDGHNTGIYSWETLYKLGASQKLNWKQYLAELEAAGHKRKEQPS